MFAVVRTGGKQYKVSKGDKIRVEKLDGNEGDTVSLSDILMVGDDKGAKTGSAVKGASVSAKVVAQTRNEKVIIFKKKRRQNYRRKNGHKQFVTILEIADIKAA